MVVIWLLSPALGFLEASEPSISVAGLRFLETVAPSLVVLKAFFPAPVDFLLSLPVVAAAFFLIFLTCSWRARGVGPSMPSVVACDS